MSQGETFITILLAVIAYFLYLITKQLSYLSGKRIRFGFKLPEFQAKRYKSDHSTGTLQPKKEPKLPN
ncbi:MAG TPA: hypothetical protein VM077_06135 [Candidatus Limnocylindrales bacterium]|nr:hypothetical protein [Candidatus Limnocylindrales bacterium]